MSSMKERRKKRFIEEELLPKLIINAIISIIILLIGCKLITKDDNFALKMYILVLAIIIVNIIIAYILKRKADIKFEKKHSIRYVKRFLNEKKWTEVLPLAENTNIELLDFRSENTVENMEVKFYAIRNDSKKKVSIKKETHKKYTVELRKVYMNYDEVAYEEFIKFYKVV